MCSAACRSRFPARRNRGLSARAKFAGVGVLVGADGLIVTNAHVVKGADEIRVVLADRREYEAKLITQDERYDLARCLRIEGSDEKFRSWSCAIPIRSRWATSCWRSAIRSA